MAYFCLHKDAHLNVLAEMGPLEESLKEIQAAHSAVIAPESSTSTGADGTFRLRSTPFVKAGGASVAASQNSGSTTSTNGNLLLDATIATGPAALSFAVAQAPSTLSITSTSTNGGEGGGLFGHTDSVATLHSPDADGVSRMHPPPMMPPQPASAGLGCAGSPGTAESLLNGGGGSVMGGDVLSLFDHNQSISGAPTLHSASSSSSLGLLPINCDVVSALGSVADSGSSNALGEMNTDGGPLQTAMLNNNAEDDDEEEEEEEDGGTTEGCLTEDDENDETLEAGLQSEKSSSVAAATASASATSAAATMEKSVLYPNQALPPPVYTNISKLQAAAQRSVGGAPKDSSSAAPDDPRRAETPPLASPTHSLYDNQPEGMRVSLVRCCGFVVEPPTTCGARQKYPLNMTCLNNTCIFISPALRKGVPIATHSPQSVNQGKGMMNASSYVLFSHHMGSYIPPEALRTDDLITSPCTSPKDDMLGYSIGHSEKILHLALLL
ncbi:hypothetical protein EGR_03523 [Echinococcus granulosus]|uniref:Uncharacterized protein n=1 Tax=Echinococcus granulosus TaxID=6210 RepID=W6V5S5_ECHGR|nr:hypothetical protein EGR_03523 [Echinococcus granulosus]EUB61709.1 hypothetical protein EGR_03523 [Echinococcus granulosus]